MHSLIDIGVKVRVSSVLNRDSKQFGKKSMFDGNDETCWNSDQDSPQWIELYFPQTVCISEIRIQFQGGFVGKKCWLAVNNNDELFTKLQDFYPEDVNSLQVFPVETNCTKALRIVFDSSTDFYGRIIVYRLSVLGEKMVN